MAVNHNLRYEFTKLKPKLKLKKRSSKCTNCHETEDLHYHHIVPLFVGGTNNPSNIVALCADCHGKAHSGNIAKAHILKAGKERAKKSDPNWKEGRPRIYSNDQINHALKLKETHSYKQVEEMTGISKSTITRAKKRKDLLTAK